MAMNPCPCGYQGHPRIPCRCPPAHVLRYRSRVSGPLLDRIDLRIDLPPPLFDELAPAPAHQRSGPISCEPRGADLRARVLSARERMAARQGPLRNAELQADDLDRLVLLLSESRKILQRAVTHRGLSARATQAVRRVARTLADLDGQDSVEPKHVAQALALRSPVV